MCPDLVSVPVSLKNPLNVAFATAPEASDAPLMLYRSNSKYACFSLSILNTMKIAFVYTTVPSARGSLGLITLGEFA